MYVYMCVCVYIFKVNSQSYYYGNPWEAVRKKGR